MVVSGLVIVAGQKIQSLARSEGQYGPAFRSPPLARVSPSLSYDEQTGITFTDNFSYLAFNVTAVAQSDPATGAGPAYLLNGLSEFGYWYQAGISYDWPMSSGGYDPGFHFSYNVFDSNDIVVLPSSGGGGLLSFSGTVLSGDPVQLALSFSSGNVIMQATDKNTGAAAQVSYNSEGATQFVGLGRPSNGQGFFTGLMTEQYFSSPYYGAGQPVTYDQTGLTVSSAVMWIGEFNINNNQPVFSDQTPSPVSLSGSKELQYLQSHGTAEAANRNELVTNLTPITLPSVTVPTQTFALPGHQTTIILNVQVPSGATVLIRSLNATITSLNGTTIGTFNLTSYAPSSITNNSTFNVSIMIPSILTIGDYTMSIVVVFQSKHPQIGAWITTQPISTNSTISVRSSLPPSTTITPPTHPSPQDQTPASNPSTLLRIANFARDIWLPFLLANVVAAIVVAAVVVLRRRPVQALPQVNSSCSSCGRSVGEYMQFCPACGTPVQRRDENQHSQTPPTFLG